MPILDLHYSRLLLKHLETIETRITRISYSRLFTSDIVHVLTDRSLLINSFRMPQEIFLFFHFCMPYSEFMITRFLPDFLQLSLAFSIPALVLAFIILHSNSAKTPAVEKNIWSFFFQWFYNLNPIILSILSTTTMSYRIISLCNSAIIFGTYWFTNIFTQFQNRLEEIRINLPTGLV